MTMRIQKGSLKRDSKKGQSPRIPKKRYPHSPVELDCHCRASLLTIASTAFLKSFSLEKRLGGGHQTSGLVPPNYILINIGYIILQFRIEVL